MMLKTLLFGLLSSCALLAADAKTVEAVKSADRAWADATVKGDAAALQNLLADDLTYTHSNGETDTKKIYVDNLAGRASTIRSSTNRSMRGFMPTAMRLW